MTIQIVEYSNTDEVIVSFDLESNPFVVGETININVKNHNKRIYTVEDKIGNYQVKKISHTFRKDYRVGIDVHFCITIAVTKL